MDNISAQNKRLFSSEEAPGLASMSSSASKMPLPHQDPDHYVVESLIVDYLSKRGLSRTLAVFHAENGALSRSFSKDVKKDNIEFVAHDSSLVQNIADDITRAFAKDVLRDLVGNNMDKIDLLRVIEIEPIKRRMIDQYLPIDFAASEVGIDGDIGNSALLQLVKKPRMKSWEIAGSSSKSSSEPPIKAINPSVAHENSFSAGELFQINN